MVPGMRWDRLTFTALGGVAAFLVGIGLLLGDERPLFAPVFGMVDGIGALAPLAKNPLQPRRALSGSALSTPVR